MKYPTVRYLFDRKKKGTDKNPAIIEIEVSHLGKRRILSTGIKVLPKQWSKEKLVIRHPDNARLNLKLTAMKKAIDDYISQCVIESREFTFQGLDEALSKQSYDGSLIDFIEERLEEKVNLTVGTRRNHHKIVSALKGYKKMLTFTQITRQNIVNFDTWLQGRGYQQSTIHTYHKLLKIYIHEAVALGLLSGDPYVGLRIDEGKKPLIRYLTEEQIEKLQSFETSNKTLQKVRDLFMFQFYTGLAYADMKKFDFTQAVVREGKYVVHDIRKKTAEAFYIVLMRQAVDILERYNFKLPVMTNEKYNFYLKSLAEEAKVDKDLTSHMARHSFAVNALNHEIPIEVVSRMLGHASVRSTMGYAKIVNKTVESAFDKLQQSLDSKG